MQRGPFDRVPFNFHTLKETRAKLESFTGIDLDTLKYEVMGVDRMSVVPDYIGPKPKTYPDGTYDNIFGVRLKNQHFANGAYPESVGFPLQNAETVSDVDAYSWPDPDNYDYAGIWPKLAAKPDYPFQVGYYSPGWFSWEMQEMSHFLLNLAMDSPVAQAVIDHICQFGLRYYENILTTGKDYTTKNFTSIHIADDWATQSGLLISPAMFRKYFLDYYREFIDLAHSHDVLVEFHACGSIYSLIPDLIDAGIDILNPIQTSAASMDPAVLKKEFGAHIAFSGGIDVQTILPFGTPSQVRDEVFRLLDAMAADGGYILEPSHVIQVDTSPENIIAFCNALFEYYDLPVPCDPRGGTPTE